MNSNSHATFGLVQIIKRENECLMGSEGKHVACNRGQLHAYRKSYLYQWMFNDDGECVPVIIALIAAALGLRSSFLLS